MQSIILAAFLATASPVQGEKIQAAEPAAIIELGHLAAARQTVDHVWPLGTFARSMSATMDQMTNQMVSAMFDMPLGDFADAVVEEGGEPTDPELAEMTMREAITAADPYFEERLRLTNETMAKAFVPLVNRIEPEVRDGLVRAFAQRFTKDQLDSSNQFFATEHGAAFASEIMLIMTNSEVTKAIAEFMPLMVREMPAIMKKVEAATAHLPPPPEAEAAEEEAAAVEDPPVT